jgi:hypothetical protein
MDSDGNAFFHLFNFQFVSAFRQLWKLNDAIVALSALANDFKFFKEILQNNHG